MSTPANGNMQEDEERQAMALKEKAAGNAAYEVTREQRANVVAPDGELTLVDEDTVPLYPYAFPDMQLVYP